MDVVSKWWKIQNFCELIGPPCRNALADLDQNVRRSALHIEPHLEPLRKIEMLAVLCTTETTPHFLSLTLLHPPPGADGPQRGRRHVGRHVDPPTRCWDIAQNPPKCKNSSLTPIVTKISFPLFFRPWGPLTPKREDDTEISRVRPHAKFGVNRPTGCGEIVSKKSEQTEQKTYSKTNTSPFVTSEWRVTIQSNRQLRNVKTHTFAANLY